MKIQYLGTAAAEGIPAIFCECEACRKSRELGGRNIRTRSQALIDDTVLIDFPADTYMHVLQHNVQLSKIKSCIITHSHSDHLYPNDFVMRWGCFAHIDNMQPLTVYSDVSGYEMTKAKLDQNGVTDDCVRAEKIEAGKSFEADGYTILPVRALHDEKSSPVLFIIEKDGKSIFYANDSGVYNSNGLYPEETMAALKNLKKPLNVVSFDCTEACNKSDYEGHLDIQKCMSMRNELIKDGAADENTLFVLNHFSHNGKDVVYDDFVKIAEKAGFLTTYDGMVLEF